MPVAVAATDVAPQKLAHPAAVPAQAAAQAA